MTYASYWKKRHSLYLGDPGAVRDVRGRTVAELAEIDRADSAQLHYAIAAAAEFRGVRSIIDIGCGLGRFADASATVCGVDGYTGIDVASTAIEIARTRHPGLRFEVHDIVEAPFGRGGYDIGIAAFLLQHLTDDDHWRSAVAHMAASVRRGLLILDTIRRGDATEDDAIDAVGHCRVRSLAQYEAALDPLGWRMGPHPPGDRGWYLARPV